MRRSLLSLVLATATLSGVAPVTLNAATTHHRHYRYYSAGAHTGRQ